ncbi:MAG: GTP cyclohydrolase I FolE2 [Thaumarchaeota archaeon]|nr:GTP cyclohydrolase I FolE2 [Nitrososphaerota archaeon]
MRHGRGLGEKDPSFSISSADVTMEEALNASPGYIDTFADTQNEPAAMVIDAGISDLKVLFHDGKVALPVSLSIQTSTGLHRGVHMSRLVHAASSHESPDIVSWLRRICKEVNASQPGSSVTCAFELPYADQFIPVSIKTSQAGAISYRFTAKGMTACPCSKKMIGVGHMQRAEIAMMLQGRKPVDMLKLIDKMEECFSAIPTEKMKRVEEAKKILEAQSHTRFAEDLVRECARRFPNSVYIRARCFESIHAHDAIATWSKKTGWVPEF